MELTYGFIFDLNFDASIHWIGGLLLELSSVFLSAYSTFNLATQSLELKSLASTDDFPSFVYFLLASIKTLFHISIQTLVGYLFTKALVDDDRFEYLRNFLDRRFGDESSLYIFGALLFMIFPLLTYTQNFIALLVRDLKIMENSGGIKF